MREGGGRKGGKEGGREGGDLRGRGGGTDFGTTGGRLCEIKRFFVEDREVLRSVEREGEEERGGGKGREYVLVFHP